MNSDKMGVLSCFVDHAIGYIFISNQVSMGIGETIQSKHAFERSSDEYGVTLKSFHADNHPVGDKPTS